MREDRDRVQIASLLSETWRCFGDTKRARFQLPHESFLLGQMKCLAAIANFRLQARFQMSKHLFRAASVREKLMAENFAIVAKLFIQPSKTRLLPNDLKKSRAHSSLATRAFDEKRARSCARALATRSFDTRRPSRRLSACMRALLRLTLTREKRATQPVAAARNRRRSSR